MLAYLTELHVQGAAQVEIVLEDPFQRLLMHGVAQYHSLHLRSCGGGDDQPLLRVSINLVLSL